MLPTVVAGTQRAAAQGTTLDLPKTFEGTIKVEQHHMQSFLPVEGHFSSFDATASFSNLVFGKGQEGPYTLLKGTVAYTGFDVQQEVPNGNFGTCDATYHFGLQASEPLFGDLGGLSESGGHWHVQISLGIHTEGSITSSTNCEPDNAGTTSPFGAPSSPKINFPVNAEGTFEPSDGTITIDDSVKYPYLGGTSTDDVSGKLTGGLQIYYDKDGKYVNVTDETTRVVVGQPIRLEARLPDGSQPDLGGKGWTGLTKSSALKDYVFQDDLAKPVFLNEGDLTGPDIKFYWVEGSATVPFDIQVTGKNRKTGDEESAETKFDVEGPKVDTFTGRTCGVGIDFGTAGGGLPSKLSLGDNDTSPGCRDLPGVAWTIDVTTPSLAGGNVGLTQTAIAVVERNDMPCRVNGVRLDGNKTYSENGTFLYQADHTLGTDQQWNPPGLGNSPYIALKNGGTWSSDTTFVDFIMFQPDIPDSIYVAVRELPWTFEGQAESSSRGWKLGTHEDPPDMLPSTPANAQPRWTGTLTEQQMSGC